jgi:hypothetical protein
MPKLLLMVSHDNGVVDTGFDEWTSQKATSEQPDR